MLISTPTWIPLLLEDNALTLQEMAALPMDAVAVDGMHLLAQLGVERVKQLGGAHHFFGWQKVIIAQCSASWRGECLYYKSPKDGAVLQMTPQTYCEQLLAMGVDCVLLPRPLGGFNVVSDQGVIGQAVRHVADLPDAAEQVRCVLSVNTVTEWVSAIERGADWVFSIAPYQQAAQHGLYTRRGLLSIVDPAFQCVNEPIDAACSCYTCQHFSRGYVHHLSSINALLGQRLRLLHNITFWFDVILSLRNALETGTLRTVMQNAELYDQFIQM